jgi:dihydrofolate reductase
MPGLVRVFIATSLDGFIAGPDHDLSWLPDPRPGEDFGYEAFMARTGAILMGRSTYEIAAGFDPWPYGDTPVLVATRRELDEPAAPTVEPVSGTPQELVGLAHEAAVGRDIYLDGGDLIRQVLDAGLVDELTITVIPVILGAGFPLFTGAARHTLRLESTRLFEGGILQLRYAPAGE